MKYSRSTPLVRRLLLLLLPLLILPLSVSSHPQYPQPPRSTQQFTVYKPIQVGYNNGGGGGGADYRESHGLPIFHFRYNVSHPYGGSSSSSSSSSSSPPNPVQLLLERQFSRNQGYPPVIITGAATSPLTPQEATELRRQQNIVAPGRANFFTNKELEREPEEDDISFRTRTNSNKAGGRIVFDTSKRPNQSFLNQLPDSPIVFSYGQQYQHQSNGRLPYRESIGVVSSSTPPPITVPYITTQTPLQKIQQIQKNKENAVSSFRSQLTQINQNANANANAGAYPLPTARQGRVSNIVVPLTTIGQSPTGVRLLQSNLQQQQQQQSTREFVENTVLNHQRYGVSPIRAAGPPTPAPQNIILKGLAVTPDNQRDLGHLIFSDNTLFSGGAGGGGVVAGSAQKVFIIPQQNGSPGYANEIAFQDEETPSEIVVTVVDEDGARDSKGGSKVLSNFSLFLLPSNYRKCVAGYRRAHDGKCRLIIKLRGRTATAESTK